jgi:hypothetical protein
VRSSVVLPRYARPARNGPRRIQAAAGPCFDISKRSEIEQLSIQHARASSRALSFNHAELSEASRQPLQAFATP